MARNAASRVVEILDKYERDLLAGWIDRQLKLPGLRRDLLDEQDLREQSRLFLKLVRDAAARAGVEDIDTAAWEPVREHLRVLSTDRARRGFTPSETATFVFSLKEPLFARLRQEIGMDANALADEMWAANLLLDRLGLFTTEVHQQGREEVISRQNQEMLELSTPVVELWQGILALPLIGTLDSARTQVVMENLLQRIVDTGASIAIIDITGVPTVDTLVAQHLLKTVAAARLMGADCLISGIRPQIAQTIVHLGVELQSVTTKATLAAAFAVALARTGQAVGRVRTPA
ncbi:MAG TPA: STAS domain-containing protein [Methylomirabilota bacterium]|nr:STAS domain-containing protein [Methylomirabilota bacterium]